MPKNTPTHEHTKTIQKHVQKPFHWPNEDNADNDTTSQSYSRVRYMLPRYVHLHMLMAKYCPYLASCCALLKRAHTTVHIALRREFISHACMHACTNTTSARDRHDKHDAQPNECGRTHRTRKDRNHRKQFKKGCAHGFEIQFLFYSQRDQSYWLVQQFYYSLWSFI